MEIHIRRREFIGALAGAATWSCVGRAQQPATPIVGWLNSEAPDGEYNLQTRDVQAAHDSLPATSPWREAAAAAA